MDTKANRFDECKRRRIEIIDGYFNPFIFIMYKIKAIHKSIVIFLLFISTLCFPENIGSQGIDEKYILNYWIISRAESSPPRETYRLRNYHFNPPIHFLILQEGIEFYKNNKFHKFRARLCGNDTQPNFTEGTWNIFQDKGVNKLRINFTTEVKLFEIIEITADKLVLKRVY